MTGGLGKIVRAGVGRRRVQTIVMTLTVLLAVTASVLAVGLVVAASAPFQKAFERLSGAHLVAAFDPNHVTTDQLKSTVDAGGVTAAAGPFGTVSQRPHTLTSHRPGGPGRPGVPAGIDLPPVTIAGRSDPGGDVDRLDITAGRWATAPGEIVWSDAMPLQVDDQVSFPGAAGNPTFTVVGTARSIGQTAQAWVTPNQVTTLAGPEAPLAYQMLYRFAQAASDDDIATDRAAIAAAVPTDALVGAASYLTIKAETERTAGVFAPFVAAFGVLGLVMSVLIISIVVGGAVSSAYQRIGILKSLGYTPAQVARAYVVQALIPAAIGAPLGVALGNVAAIPVLREEGDAFGTGVPGLEPWISVVVPLVVLAIVALAALFPAMRASRLRTVDAIAVGRTPSVGRGRAARRLLGRLPLPRAMSLGLGSPLTRPGRSTMIGAAVALGALGVTFGTGLALSVAGIQDGVNMRDAGDVIVHSTGIRVPQGQPVVTEGATAAQLRAAIEGQSGTDRYFATAEGEVTVAGISGTTPVITYAGDHSWGSYQIIEGRWFSAAGEAVLPTAFLKATGLHVGDTLKVTSGADTATLRIVGEVLDLDEGGLEILTDAGSLTGLDLASLPGSTQYHIQLTAGTDLKSYVDKLNATLEPLHANASVNTADISDIVIAMDTLTAMLTLMLITVAGLGVLNTVVLDTRERVHDLGVFKALGMSPRQTIAMVLTSVAAIGVLAGLIGVPAGIVVHDWIIPAMGEAAGTGIPSVDLDVYTVSLLIPLALGGLVIAIAGALLPAGWAARTSTTKALRTE